MSREEWELHKKKDAVELLMLYVEDLYQGRYGDVPELSQDDTEYIMSALVMLNKELFARIERGQ